MRMHPGVAFPLERIVPPGGTQLCGMQIPADTIVGVNAAVIHRNIDIFGADANAFRPERWLDKDEERIKTMNRFLLTVSTICCSLHFPELTKRCNSLVQEREAALARISPSWRWGSWCLSCYATST